MNAEHKPKHGSLCSFSKSEDTKFKCNPGAPCKYNTLQYQANTKVLMTFNPIICIRGCKLQYPERSDSVSCKKEKRKQCYHHIKNQLHKRYFSCLNRGTQGPPFFVKINRYIIHTAIIISSLYGRYLKYIQKYPTYTYYLHAY